MKKYFLILLFVTVTAKGFSQQNKTQFKGAANYLIKLAEDVFTFDGELIFTDTQSTFVYKKNNKTKWFRDNEAEFKSQLIYTDSSGYQIFTNLKTKELQVREFCRQNQAFIYKDAVNIKWQLGSEHKEVNGLQCSDAYTRFRGRDYIAWYAIDVPTSAGPWKFNGLPGLIVLIEDKRGEVWISLQSLKLGTNAAMPKLGSGTEVSLIEFQKNMDKAYKEQWEKNDAIINKLQAENPDIEIENTLPLKRVATEIEFK
jgi:GLPGLI family protein